MKDKKIDIEKELIGFLNNNLLFNLNRVTMPLNALYDLILEKEYNSEITFLQIDILIAIYYYFYYKGFSPSVFDLSDFMGAERTTMLRKLNRHSKRGLVIGTDTVVKNKRIKIYHLSDKAKILIENFLPVLNDINGDIIAKKLISNTTVHNLGGFDLNGTLIEQITIAYKIIYGEIKRMREEMGRRDSD